MASAPLRAGATLPQPANSSRSSSEATSEAPTSQEWATGLTLTNRQFESLEPAGQGHPMSCDFLYTKAPGPSEHGTEAEGRPPPRRPSRARDAVRAALSLVSAGGLGTRSGMTGPLEPYSTTGAGAA